MGYWQSVKRFSLVAIAATAVTLSTGLRSDANTPNTAPETLTTLLNSIETAANNHELDTTLGFYSEGFQHSDGLSRESYGQFLAGLWEDYPRMEYDINLLSWEQEGDRLIAETETKLRGIRKESGRWSHLHSTVRAKQYFENGQLVEQEILSESSELTSGDNPPIVSVLIPEVVKPKEDFGFDVIVNDPLGNEILLGAATEQIIGDTTYSNPDDFDLDILPAGGIFKRVEAPEETGDVWYSAIIIRSDGITLVSHRVKVQES
ncbi:hypothetical protein Lepto7376_3532 [[Leptolyngbya] sp. PCC 7376]|uniref:hypothetical protein n=1 Tax=[Leptolyngbya] sp. PCC 7376 TaxID=111781 RepID=UPI00029ED264|nr:hypothetical protein [[Leptolyngbya] sp. PCC 7376]AFY39729.1 hypothetical protein Lepto7376_3532 [[Leptolyngbya] sp. PCC 7376]